MNSKSDKKRYEAPEIDVVRLGGEDVIRTSPAGDDNDGVYPMSLDGDLI